MVNIGAWIGNRYEVIEKVGTGGMATVYRAKDHRLNRFVAVKVLKNEYSEDTKFVSKFRQEAQAIACMSHPNIVGVYDVGEEEGMHYIVMEFVDGITLKKYIEKHGKLSVREAVGISLQIANGLEAAHNNHIIHRDIKPQNILIAKDGTAKVTDFGIAKAASSNTVTASAMGSVHYISPEQARGGFSDEKSDIYSLGVTLYEMLSGTLPFGGESAVAVALAHIQEDAIPLIAMDATIPKGLSNIVAKCMQKKTELRYPSAADLIADMKMFLQDPNGEYGIIKPLYENAETIFIPNGDVNRIKAASSKIAPEEAMEEEEEDASGGDVDPKLEKALIIGSVVVAIIIATIIIVMLGKFIGLWGGSSLPSATATPAPTADEAGSTDPTETPDSTDEEQVAVPAVKDMEKNKAIVELENNNLQYKFTEQESDTADAGKVIGTNPEEGSTVAKGTVVEVYISAGPKKVKLPSVNSYTESDATSTLETAGFKVKVGSPVYSDSVAKDLVAYTSPKAGSQVTPGSTVTLYISKGQELTSVPDLMGMTQKQAKNALEAKGLKLGSKISKIYSSNVSKNRVCIQSKAEGTQVKKGTTVEITLSLGEEPTYSYYTDPVMIDDPDEYMDDERANYKFVLSQGGRTTTIKEVSLSHADFPYSLGKVKGSGEGSGSIIIYKNGEQVDSYPVTFKKVAD